VQQLIRENFLHPAAETFFQSVKSTLPQFFENVSVLDFGSYDVNGSLRPLFTSSKYIGVDLIPGPGVTLVGDCSEISFKEFFDVGLSSECFEHNPQWLGSFQNLTRHTKPTGLVLFSCAATNRPKHGTKETNPSDSPGTQAVGWNYYRNLCFEDFCFLAGDEEFSSYRLYENPIACDLYFVGMRKDFEAVVEEREKILAEIWKKLGGFPTIRSKP